MMNKAGPFQALADLGSGPLTTKQERAALEFVLQLYGHSNSKCTNLNELRFDKANTKTTAKKLPPTEDSFHLHLLRCAYQLLLWRQCIFAMIEIPEPSDYGYEKVADSQGYFPKLMNQSPAAPELLIDLICNCNSNSCSDQCSCFF